MSATPSTSTSKLSPPRTWPSSTSTSKLSSAPAPVSAPSSSSSSPSQLRHGFDLALLNVKAHMTGEQVAAEFIREARILVERNAASISNQLEALRCLDEALSHATAATAFLLRAAAHKQLFLFEEAYFDFSFLARIEPKQAAHRWARSLVLLQLKKISAAKSDIDAAIALEPSSLHFYTRGSLFAETGEHDRALTDLNRALKRDARDHDDSAFRLRCLHRRASVLFALQRFPGAVKDLLEVLSADPGDHASRVLLARALKMMGELAKAEAQINVAINRDPSAAVHYAERGDIRVLASPADPTKLLGAMDDYDRAVELLEGHHILAQKKVALRARATLKVRRRRAQAAAARLTEAERTEAREWAAAGPAGRAPTAAAAAAAAAVSAPPLPTQRPGRPATASAHGKTAAERLRDLTDPVAKSRLRQAKISDHLYRKLNCELLPRSDAEHEALFVQAAVASRNSPQKTPRQEMLTGLMDEYLSQHAAGADAAVLGALASSRGMEVHRARLAASRRREAAMAAAAARRRSRSRSPDARQASFSTAAAAMCEEEEDEEAARARAASEAFDGLVAEAMRPNVERLADVLCRRAHARLLAGGFDFAAAQRTETVAHRLRQGDDDGGNDDGTSRDGSRATHSDTGGGSLGDAWLNTVAAAGAATAAAGHDVALVRAALADASRASDLCPRDEEYRLLVASCHLHLGATDAARAVVDAVIARAPHNEKARLLKAFCLRSKGRPRAAIDELTYLLTVAHAANADRRVDPFASNFLVPPARAHGARGALFRALHAHADALPDLEAAARLLESADPTLWYLLGDSKAAVGDYAGAVAALTEAERQGAGRDLGPLLVTRGLSRRLLGQLSAAMEDFLHAGALLRRPAAGRPAHAAADARVALCQALCLLDIHDYAAAKATLLAALARVDVAKSALLPPSAVVSVTATPPRADSPTQLPVDCDDDDADGGGGGVGGVAVTVPPYQMTSSVDGPTALRPSAEDVHHIALLFRLEWLLRYHAALAHYHLKQYGPAAAALGRCLSTRVGDWSDGGGEGLRAHAHGEVAVGACLFHLGVASAHLGRLDAAAEALDGAARSAWARAAPPRAGPPLAHAPTEARLTHDHLRHQALCCFARAKVHQRRQQHGEAALLFTLALDISASSAAPDAGARFDSFALFRRGWAHRAMHDLRRAGEDLESARHLQPFDPNFAIEYKHTDHVLYSELSHEPDITEPFLPLVVLPRSI